MPRCKALSLLQKLLHYRGIHLSSCPAFVYVGLGPVVTRARVLVYEVLDRSAQTAFLGGARCASQVLDRGAQADDRFAVQVLDRCTQAVAYGAARCVSQVLDRGDVPSAEKSAESP